MEKFKKLKNKVVRELAAARKGEKTDPAVIDKIMMDEPKIKIGKSSFGNPLVTCEVSKYAGHPDNYEDLSNPMLMMLRSINKILETSGIPILTMMYAARSSKQYSGINFVVMNSDRSFMWRKYDPSGGAGQNWVYFKNGVHINTSVFLTNPGKYLHDNM